MSKKMTAVYLLLLILCPHTSFSATLLEQYKTSSEAQAQKAHAAAQNISTSAQTYEMLTYNVGLLNGWIAKVPFYNERSQTFITEIEKYTSQTSTDVIFLQELWYANDRQALKDWALTQGYISVNATIDAMKPAAPVGRGNAEWRKTREEKKHLFHNPAQTGLEILIKKSIVRDIKHVGFHEYLDQNGGNLRATFEAVAWADLAFGQEIKRGSLSAVIRLKTDQVISLFTSHLTPLTDNNSIRLAQLRSLQQHIKETNSAHNTQLSFIGADFNLSPLWENLIGGTMDGTPEAWDQNAESYFTFIKESGFIDAFAVSQPLGTPGYTQDRAANALTSTSNSTKTEPEQRIDYVMVKGQVPYKVQNTHLVFNSPLEGTQDLFLSDHLGVSLSILF